MDDLISRQAVINEAEEWIETYTSGRGGQRERDAIKHVISGIKTMPSAQPERKNGDWVRTSFYNDTPVCSECYSEGRWDWDYCPNCGADMRGKQDE